jgi:uncharacterized membrane protein YhhN
MSTAIRTRTVVGRPRPHVAANPITPSGGTAVVHTGLLGRCALTVRPYRPARDRAFVGVALVLAASVVEGQDDRVPVRDRLKTDRLTSDRLTTARLATAGYAALALSDATLAASPSPAARRLRFVTKPLLMPALGTAFSTSLAGRDIHRGGLLRGATVAGQALSGVGDIALLGKGRTAFLAGLGAFLGAQVAYTTGFVSAMTAGRERRGVAVVGAGVVAGVSAGAAALTTPRPVLGGPTAHGNSALLVPVAVYAGALGGTVAAASQVDQTVSCRARRAIVAGATLFLVSDMLVAGRELLLEDAPRGLDAAAMAGYALAQGLIAAGVSQAVRSRCGH